MSFSLLTYISNENLSQNLPVQTHDNNFITAESCSDVIVLIYAFEQFHGKLEKKKKTRWASRLA